MENKILLQIVTPERSLLEEPVEEVTAPGSEGTFGVLPGHAPFLTTLKPGEISYRVGGKTSFIAVSWGYAEVGAEKVTILAETAEPAQEIDAKRAEEKKREAEKLLSQLKEEDKNFVMAEASLEKALVRLQVASKPHGGQ